MKIVAHYSIPLFFLTVAATLSFFTQRFFDLETLFNTGNNGFFFGIVLILGVTYGLRFIPTKNPIPIFVWAILFGMALQTLFTSLMFHKDSFLIVLDIIAAFILFASGLHIPIKNFKKYFAPIATLSVLGTILSVLLFAITLSLLTIVFGVSISTSGMLILAAILSSIDPTVVLNTLNKLHFKHHFIKDIAIAESAINDVVGIILTRFLLLAILGTATLKGAPLQDHISVLFSQPFLGMLALEIIWGILVGLLGSWILTTWGESVGKKHWSDPALFMVIPLFCFALGSFVGTAGFFAAFIAGILTEIRGSMKEIHDFFEAFVDRFMNTTVFIALGAFTPLHTLIETMSIGFFAAIIFMFIIRPFVVYLSLLPFMITKNKPLNWHDVCFLSFIRETGVVPALLLLYITISQFSGGMYLMTIGVWVILFTLIIEPPLSLLLAKRLEISS